MVSRIGKGRNIPCLNSKGGNETIYLAKWSKDINYSLVDDQVSNLSGLSFFKFESLDVIAGQSLEHSDRGEIYSIDISFSLLKVDKETSATVNSLIDMFLVAVVFDNYGQGRIFGLKNGLSGSFSETSGGAKQSFSGYQIKLKGEQTEKQYYINSITQNDDLNLTGLFVNSSLLYVNNKAVILS